MRLSELGEDAFLRELQKRFPAKSESVVLGIGDDAAILDPPAGERLLLTTDSLVEGVHFARRWMPPKFLGRKAVAVNASDIAAMGGEPLAVLLSLAVPSESEVQALWQLVEGVDERARELGMSLVGGNLASSPGGIHVDVTVVGATAGRRALRRSGARPGNGIYLSGKIGAAITGLRLLEEGAVLAPAGGLIVPEGLRSGPLPLAETCIRAHIDPEPRLALGRELNRRRLATACIDVSDGLALDLHRLSRASGVGARIQESALPLSPGLLAWERVWKRDPMLSALGGGEDYELLFTGSEEKLSRYRERSDLLLTRIGETTAEERVELVGRDGVARPMPASGWDHFGARAKGERS
ncbi:MAG TPA: thiamine-phosphate kinase [Vicinamibacteria bacterium]